MQQWMAESELAIHTAAIYKHLAFYWTVVLEILKRKIEACHPTNR